MRDSKPPPGHRSQPSDRQCGARRARRPAPHGSAPSFEGDCRSARAFSSWEERRCSNTVAIESDDRTLKWRKGDSQSRISLFRAHSATLSCCARYCVQRLTQRCEAGARVFLCRQHRGASAVGRAFGLRSAGESPRRFGYAGVQAAQLHSRITRLSRRVLEHSAGQVRQHRQECGVPGPCRFLASQLLLQLAEYVGFVGLGVVEGAAVESASPAGGSILYVSDCLGRTPLLAGPGRCAGAARQQAPPSCSLRQPG